MSCRILPQELIDSIINYTHDDPATLKSCALVSCAWLPASRYHLFRSVSVRLSEGTYHDYANPPSGGAADSLYRIVLSSPAIAWYIRDLVICKGSPLIWMSHDEFLPPLLRMLTNLRRLEFEPLPPRGVFGQWPGHLVDSICTARCLPSITELVLFNLSFDNQAHLRRMFRLFPALKVLQLQEVMFVMEVDDDDMVYRRDKEKGDGDIVTTTQRTRLDVLSVDSPHSLDVTECLLHPQSPIDLTGIYRLNLLMWVAPNSSARLLRSTPCLERLEVDLKCGIWVEPDGLDISHNSVLRSLHLRFDVKMGYDPLPWLPKFFSTVRSPNCLEEILLMVTIDLPPPHLEHSTYEESLRGWRDVDSVLTRSDFSRLQRVRLTLDSPTDDRVMLILDDILAQCPNLDRQGILFVDACEVR